MLTLSQEKEITERIRVKELILFGSHAYGSPDKNSDIDIVVILDETGIAEKYNEILERRVRMSKLLIDIERVTPLDILVYTPDEWEQLLNTGSAFINEINSRGRRIA